MYTTKFILGIRDKRNFNKWHRSPQFDTIDALLNEYKQWIADHPGRIISVMTERVWVPEVKEQA